MREIIVDNFAGGGGASFGIKMAIGRDVDIAINHDPAAIAMYITNHPNTKVFCENIWEVDPVKATQGQPVALAWFSPDCTHFSKAKGAKPVDKNIRGLAWVVLRWAAKVRPRVIMLENVEEFQTWGPVRKGRPIKSKKGQTFNLWKSQLESLGYKVEHRELIACDYGAPTSRKRFFLVARCDGNPIRWPEPTHADPDSMMVRCGLLKPWRTAAEIIDWSLPCPSIFERKKPLAENTLRRIAKGIQKFIIDNPSPYIVNMAHGGKFESLGRRAFVAPFLTQYHGEKSGREVRGQVLTEPLMTVDSNPRYALVSAFVSKFYKTGIGQSLKEPLHTITTSPGHFAEVRAFLMTYYGNGDDIGQRLTEPLRTITSKDRFGIITVAGHDYQIVDIGMRMLAPRELFRAQGFPDEYIIDHDYTGKRYPKSAQVARCGNAVPPPFSEALVRENLPEICRKEKVG